MMQEMNTSAPFSAVEVLKADKLRKSYGPREALRGLSFSLLSGRILGFLGPNGAGKTTAIRILTTIMEPDSGSFVVDGIGSGMPEKIRHRIGVLPESLGFHKHITAIEYLVFFGQLYGLTAAAARNKGMSLLGKVGLENRAKSLIGSYSRGMRQRLGIARAIINDPVVVFLDEPTLGLDPRGQQELLDLVKWIAREQNTAVILCSHLLAEVESVCDDVIILSTGQVVASGTVAEVITKTRAGVNGATSGKGLRVQVPPQFAVKARHALTEMPTLLVTALDEKSGMLQVDIETRDDTAAEDLYLNNRILERLIKMEIPITRFEGRISRLQDVFLQLTEEKIT